MPSVLDNAHELNDFEQRLVDIIYVGLNVMPYAFTTKSQLLKTGRASNADGAD